MPPALQFLLLKLLQAKNYTQLAVILLLAIYTVELTLRCRPTPTGDPLAAALQNTTTNGAVEEVANFTSRI